MVWVVSYRGYIVRDSLGRAKARILLMDDGGHTAVDLLSRLQALGYEVCVTTGFGTATVKQSKRERFDLVFMDNVINDEQAGLDAAVEAGRVWGLPLILMTDQEAHTCLDLTTAAYPVVCLSKSFTDRELRICLDMALYAAGAQRERLRAEDELLRERNFAHAILEATDVMLAYLDRHFKFLAVSKAYAEFCRVSPEDLVGWNHFDLYPHGENEAIFRQVRDTGESVFYKDKPFEYPDHPERGTTYWDWSLKPVKGSAGVVQGLVFTLSETTNYRKMELALRNSESRFRAFTEHAPVGIYATDLEGNFNYVNKTWCKMAGLTPEEALGQGWINGLYQEDRETVCENWYRSVQSDEQWGYEYRFRGEDDQSVWVLGKAWAILDEDDRAIGYIGTNIDITEQKLVESALQAQRETLKKIFEGVSYILMVVDGDGRIEDINRAGAIFAGRPQKDLIGLLGGEIFNCLNSINEPGCGRQSECSDCPIRSRVRHTLETGEAVSDGEGSMIFIKDHEEVQVHLLVSTIPVRMGEVDKVLVTIADITERKRAEEARLEVESRVQNSQRLEAIGVLSGGIAHDFNNILSAILGYTELAMMDTGEDSPLHHVLKQITKAGLRGRDLIQQILSFSRRVENNMAPLHLSHVVKEAIKFMRVSMPSTIEVKYNIDPDENAVMVDPTQIHQVLMNLGTNSAYAMRESGGTLEINMRKLDVHDDVAAAGLDLAIGKYQELTVRDNGEGIEAGIIERIFDPFFTTKPLGVGTGLGLATIHGIIKSHGGTVRISSELGQGTTFKVYLPCVPGDAAAESPRVVMPTATGTERILFVDDEASLVDVGRKMMGRLGYVFTGATSGVEALQLFLQDPDRFDLIITDQTMPGLTGVELARHILEIRPKIPIILFTGYGHTVDQEEALAMGIKRFLLKPFVLQELIKAVRESLDEVKNGTDIKC